MKTIRIFAAAVVLCLGINFNISAMGIEVKESEDQEEITVLHQNRQEYDQQAEREWLLTVGRLITIHILDTVETV